MIKSFSKFSDGLAVKKAKESNNKKHSPTKFLQPIIKIVVTLEKVKLSKHQITCED